MARKIIIDLTLDELITLGEGLTIEEVIEKVGADRVRIVDDDNTAKDDQPLRE